MHDQLSPKYMHSCPHNVSHQVARSSGTLLKDILPPANVKFRTCMNSIFNFCAVKPLGEVASCYTLQQILATFFRFRCLNLIRHYSIKSQFMVQDSLTMRLMIQIWYLCISINPFKFFLAKVELDSHFFPPSSYWKMLMLAFQIYSPINSFQLFK